MGATDHIPRVPLGFLPTPVERLARLGDRLGIDLWLERDDYTGFGGGGNKVRKLEFLMAEALAQGATLLVTTGGHQSNHARIVAAAVCRFGMRSILVLRGEAPAEYQGNLLLDRLFGAELDFLPWDDYPPWSTPGCRRTPTGREPPAGPTSSSSPPAPAAPRPGSSTGEPTSSMARSCGPTGTRVPAGVAGHSRSGSSETALAPQRSTGTGAIAVTETSCARPDGASTNGHASAC